MFKKIASCFSALVLTAAFIPCTGVYAIGPSVTIWVSQVNTTDTGMALGLAQQSSIQFDDDNGSTINNLIIVDETNTYQTIDWFGASITEASVHLYQEIW